MSQKVRSRTLALSYFYFTGAIYCQKSDVVMQSHPGTLLVFLPGGYICIKVPVVRSFLSILLLLEEDERYKTEVDLTRL